MATIPSPSPLYLGPPKWHGGDNNKPIKRIIIHATAGAEAGVVGAARSTVAYSKRTTRPSSFHYCADSKESVQYTYDSTVAYGDGRNTHELHYELSCSLAGEGKGHWATDSHQAMLKIAAKDVAQLCLHYAVPMEKLSWLQVRADGVGIAGHNDVRLAFPSATSHWDPGPYFPWDAFIAMVRAEAQKLLHASKPAPVPAPAPAPVQHKKHRTMVAVPGGQFVHIHSSSRFDRSPDSLDKAIHGWAHEADLITITEVYTDARKRALPEAGFKYAVGTRGSDQCVVAWKDCMFKLIAQDTFQVTDKTYFTTDGKETAPVRTVMVVLEHRATGMRLLVSVGHYPSFVQGHTNGFWSTATRRVVALQSALLGTRKIKSAWVKKYKVNAVLVEGDTNLDEANPAIAAWFKVMFPSLRSTWGSTKGKGSLGKRFIDNAFVRGLLVVKEPVARDTPSSDHRYVTETLTLAQPKKKAKK